MVLGEVIPGGAQFARDLDNFEMQPNEGLSNFTLRGAYFKYVLTFYVALMWND